MKYLNRLILFLYLLFAGSKVNAQSGFEQLIKAGPEDATRLVDAYSKPLLRGFGLGMNSGWTNTAQTLGLFHFGKCENLSFKNGIITQNQL